MAHHLAQHPRDNGRPLHLVAGGKAQNLGGAGELVLGQPHLFGQGKAVAPHRKRVVPFAPQAQQIRPPRRMGLGGKTHQQGLVVAQLAAIPTLAGHDMARVCFAQLQVQTAAGGRPIGRFIAHHQQFNFAQPRLCRGEGLFQPLLSFGSGHGRVQPRLLYIGRRAQGWPACHGRPHQQANYAYQ